MWFLHAKLALLTSNHLSDQSPVSIVFHQNALFFGEAVTKLNQLINVVDHLLGPGYIFFQFIKIKNHLRIP